MREREREKERERAGERERKRERVRERERKRERERPNTKIRQKKITPTIFAFVDSGPISLGFSRESPAADTWYYVAYVYNGELVPPMGNQRVGIFPPKSEILFVLSLALIWCRNFQDRTIPVGGDTWPCFWRKEGIRIKRTRKKPYASVWEAVRNKHGSKVAGQSRDRRPTVKQLFSEVSSNWNNMWKKSLNGHVTVVGDHATVGRLSNNIFSTFQAIRNFFEKSRWTVTRQQPTRRLTVKQRFLDVSSSLGKFWKKSLNGHATVVGGHATVGRLSNNVFVRFKLLEIFLKKVAERSRDSGRRSRDCRPTVKQRYLDVSSN